MKASLTEALVIDVRDGKGKRYAVTILQIVSPDVRIDVGEKVTFSLSEWNGQHEPAKGQVVILEDIEKFNKGWRARRAEPVKA